MPPWCCGKTSHDEIPPKIHQDMPLEASVGPAMHEFLFFFFPFLIIIIISTVTCRTSFEDYPRISFVPEEIVFRRPSS